MSTKIEKLVARSFYLLFFLVPLVLYPYTFEVFEFNKMVLVYILTTIIIALWLARTVLAKRIIFRRTFLDIPLLIFLSAQIISTLLSIDIRTSLLGYYSRFHGGLISSISYALLYWAWVSNMNRKRTLKAIYVTFASAVLVSIYAVFQHFGIDKDIWVQDVQNRVFSTLGQPNWLAAWIVAIIPLTWAYGISNFQFPISIRKTLSSAYQAPNAKLQISKRWFWVLLSGVFFLVLLYTKSRSGLLGFIIAATVFWSLSFLPIKKSKSKPRGFWKLFIIHNSLFIILVLIVGTPWTPNLNEILSHQSPITDHRSPSSAPALEIGGSKSSEIRKIVWQGAVDIWKNYPVFGSGVETFAFSYYNFRPVEHNLVSEWDFLYNKAHNEYLNFAATTGSTGLISYLVLIIATIYILVKESGVLTNITKGMRKTRKIISDNSQNISDIRDMNRNLPLAMLAGYISILVTNFFGFSVVPVALLFFLYPAFASTLAENEKLKTKNEKLPLNNSRKTLLVFLLLATCYMLHATAKYYFADLAYSKAKLANDSLDYVLAKEKISKA
ncbi:O-antigen ligase family protein, partial [Patescibacteria group bacterium]|nr:O-antigen ligase family protein [Patescibacteria group bacterium]